MDRTSGNRVSIFFKEILNPLQIKQPWAINIVMYEALGGGVTRSLSLDTHGKSLSSLLLDMEVIENAPDR